jgi:uncharacterized protein YchJ
MKQVNRDIFKKISIVIIAAAIFTGCSAKTGTELKDSKPQTVKVTKNLQRNTPEETIKSYYANEVNSDAEFLSKYFINPQMSEVDLIKKKINAFKVKKIEVIKLFNMKKQGDYAVSICSFNTYFNGIEKPRPDIEVVSLVNKNGTWYILNDYGSVSDKDMNWLNETNSEQKKFAAKDNDIKAIIKQSENFDKINSKFLDKSNKAMIQMKNTNNTSF